jgi:hypothetical protein
MKKSAMLNVDKEAAQQTLMCFSAYEAADKNLTWDIKG